MALQFIFGPAGAGKTHRLIKDMIDKSMEMEDKHFVAVVPEQYSMETQKEILDMHPNHGCFNIEVTSLTRLAYAVFEEQGVTDINVMDDLSKTLVIRKVLEECKDSLLVYKGKTSMMGFTEKVKTVISEFRQYNIGQEQLDSICESVDDYPVLKMKFQDLSIINDGFNRYIKDKAITSEDLLTLLCGYINKSDYIKNTYFYFDSFTGFTPVQYKVLEQIMKYCPGMEMTITLPVSQVDFKGYSPYELFYLSKETVVKLREIAIKNSVDILKDKVIDFDKDIEYKEKSRLGRISEPLKFIEKNIFRDAVKEHYEKENDNVQICALNNPKSECEYVASTIAGLIKNEGYRFNDFAVIAADIEGYHKYISQAFEMYEIPCFIDHKEDVLSNKYVDGILAAIDVINRNFSIQSVMRFLRQNFMDIDREECDIFENYILKSNRRGYSSYTKQWEVTYKFMEENHINIVNDVRNKIVDGFKDFKAEFTKKGATVYDKTKAVFMFMEKHNVQEKINQDIKQFEQMKMEVAVKEYSQIMEAVIAVLDRLVSLMSDEIISNKEYADILEAGFAQIKIGIIPPGIDTVMVGNIERTRLKDAKKILFFVGINDGIVPNTSSGGGIITDSERDILKENEYVLAPTTRDNIFKQRIYLYSLFAKPLEKIVMCYSNTGTDGRTIRKSYVIGVIQNLFPNLRIKNINQIEIKPEEITNKNVALQYLAESINNYRINDNESDFSSYLSSILFHDNDTEKYMYMILDGGFYNSNTIRSIENYARQLYGIPGNIGITRLEAYAKCAYSQFLAYGLKLQEREQFSIQAYDIGNLFHQSIQKFFQTVNDRKISWKDITDAQNQEIINQAVDEVLEGYENEALEGSARNVFITNQVKEISQKTAKVLVSHIKSGKFKPAEYEIPLKHGVVDRIDTYETDDKMYVKVIDYKSGNVIFDITKAYYGIQMQLLVYINDAVDFEQKKTKKQVLPAAGLYFNIKDPYVNIQNAHDIVKNYRDVHKDNDESDSEIIKNAVFNTQLAEYQMTGIVSNENEIVTAVDSALEDSKKSQIVKLTRKNDGTPDSNSQVLDQDTYMRFIKHVSKKAEQLKDQLFNGEIDVNPIEGACTYCAYKDICKFDPSLGDEYRNLENVTYKNINDFLQEQ